MKVDKRSGMAGPTPRQQGILGRFDDDDHRPPAPRKAKQRPRSRGRSLRDRYATFPDFMRVLANLVQHDQFPPTDSPAECVRTLGRRHGSKEPPICRMTRWRWCAGASIPDAPRRSTSIAGDR